ncbi:MAG: hypothetical protein ABWK01_07985 [Infirmifilum sp.]
MMRKIILVIMALLAVFVTASAVATPLTVNIKLTTPYTKYYVYTATTLAAQGNITSNTFTLNYNNTQSYLVKAVGNNTVLVFTIPSGLTTTSFNVTTVATVTFNTTFLGKWPFAPKSVQAQVAPSGAPCNATVATSDVVNIVPPAKVKLQKEVFYPAIYGYRLSAIYVNGATSTNPFNVTSSITYSVKAEYEPVGMAAIDPLVVVAVVAAIVVFAIVLAAKKGGSAAMAVKAYNSPYLE